MITILTRLHSSKSRFLSWSKAAARLSALESASWTSDLSSRTLSSSSSTSPALTSYKQILEYTIHNQCVISSNHLMVRYCYLCEWVCVWGIIKFHSSLIQGASRMLFCDSSTAVTVLQICWLSIIAVLFKIMFYFLHSCVNHSLVIMDVIFWLKIFFKNLCGLDWDSV